RRRHTSFSRDWSSDVCSSDLHHLPDRGTITLDGVDITRWSEHRRAGYIGRVFQDPLQGTAASMTIEENLSMAELRGKRRTLRRRSEERRVGKGRGSGSAAGSG